MTTATVPVLQPRRLRSMAASAALGLALGAAATAGVFVAVDDDAATRPTLAPTVDEGRAAVLREARVEECTRRPASPERIQRCIGSER